MRLIKITLLAATAAVAAMAFIGGSTASATGTWIGLCKAAELLNCAKANLTKHPLKGKLITLAGKSIFQSNFKTTCEVGEGETASIEAQQQASFKGTIELLFFASCSGDCTFVNVKTPQAAELNMETEAGENWRLKAANVKIVFANCIVGGGCEFEGTLNLKVQMDAAGAYADPEGTSFTRIQGSALLCGSTLKWEEGRTRFDWMLDDGTVDKNVWPSLIGKSLIAT